MSDYKLQVDVVIPTFDRDDSLFRAIDSALIQGECINRIWVIDDGSTKEVQRRIQERYLNNIAVKVICLEHCGHPGKVRKVGIENSEAKWIAFLDSDDWWHPGKIYKQLRIAEKYSAQAITCNARVFKAGKDLGLLHEKLPKKLTFKRISKTNLVINSMLMVKREELLKIGLYADSDRVRTPEDYATWLRLTSNIDIYVVDEEGGGYQISETSVRRFDYSDPRIYAFADFLLWSNYQTDKYRFRRNRKLILKSLAREYV